MLFLQLQNPIISPGTGSTTSHTFEVLLMLLGAWLLGWFLHHLIYCTRHQARIKELEGQLKSAGNRINDLEGDLESCNSAVVKIKGENASLVSQISKLEREKADWLTRDVDTVKDKGGEQPVQKSSTILSPPADLDLVEDVPSETKESQEDLLISGLASDIAGPAQTGFDSEKARHIFGRNIHEDDLQIIEGIGPKTSKLFVGKGIHTWRQLGNTSVTQLQHILDEAGPPYTQGDPNTWPKQARMAADGEWSKLREYQQYLLGGGEPSVEHENPIHSSQSNTFSSPENPSGAIKTSLDEGEESEKRTGQETSVASQAPDEYDLEEIKAIYGRAYQQNDLRIIEGIGPKTADLLVNKGIDTWKKLSETSVGQLQGILDRAGSRFQLLNPNTWPKQAGLAASGDWTKLRSYQDQLVGGLEPDGGIELSADDSDIKYAMGKRIESNDLTIVEGIGPKTAELLSNAGISTWHQLGQTSVERLQEVLDRAGSRFQLLDPATWPKQAMLAARDDWDALEEYQKFLVGGKEPS
ncbi:MAG: helix-hairpin-helix domain-containing protein [Saprospiraceae bacterium]|nr:helix-hairpin-helix domain-containing protein [Saprospiraceae bacterium]